MERGIETIKREVLNQILGDALGRTIVERKGCEFAIVMASKMDNGEILWVMVADGEGSEWSSLAGKRQALKQYRKVLTNLEKISVMSKKKEE